MLYEYHFKVLDGTYTDESCIGFFYELDDPKEIEDQTNWLKCNPSLGEIKKWSFIRGVYDQSLNDPSIKPTVMTPKMK